MKFVNLIKKAFRALSERQILPIFLLYFITSAAFLVFFAQMFFEREKYFIFDRDAFVVRDLEQGLQNRLRIAGKINDGDFDDIEAFAINLKTGEEIEDDFEPRDGMPRRYKDGLDSVVQFYLKNGQGEEEYYVAVKVADPEFAILMLKLKIIFFSFIILLAILIIAYFIIRLSLRPLYRRIDFLNGFIRDTTHEINTPLSVILMSIEMFETDPQKYLNNIKTASKTISTLYEDLTLVKFGGEEDNAVTTFSLSELVRDRLSYFGLNLEQKNINLNAQIAEVQLRSSYKKVRKIIDNLLSNAIKYCDENGDVGVNLTPLALTISNGGAGIAKENLSRIFDLYARFDERNGGFGIGLHIVKTFCDELGFKISCKSKEGLTEFMVEFGENVVKI
ncbi:ATPase/histidine kinase/DNA gyrase B/HSP90 domain protein [Campylobacter rectus RM3267]|uniref:histidine kinase n=2 Tax=Campylobacter rectus TaxID=203 RepID=A0A6G5QM48_CAMRE|nr:HAMP domain-containing sensor histidine kinase [Campylobacter rectus]EEF13056.1 ATPase/histidine kinase/DNA gyrase B/HSP90 domain protein [Campylobacter rectus RM3267]QCD46778.1 two-component system sensor histidine kinase [Campylobacter rectus]RRD54148.1 sensor histidine kinase [Campylobacter rectus]UEB47484.1 HAMP domain-containing histidine kinase [Campylobacter rectus]